MARKKEELSRAEQEGMLHELLARYSGRERAKLESAVGQHTGRGDRLLSHLHEKQLAFANDPHKRKSACCSRRAGKTVCVAAMCGQYAENYPGGLCIYIVTTRRHAQELLWPELKRLNVQYSLGWRFNNALLYVRTPGGGVIALAGADKADEIEKFRGLAPVFVAIDESASFKPYITELIEEVLEPALEDYEAPLVLVGTPGKFPKGYFYEATEGSSQEWSRHYWTVLDNPMFPRWAGKPDWRKRAESSLQAIMVRKGWTPETPKFKREYMGLWCRDESRMLYRYSAHRNLVHELPARAWRFVMGIDLGSQGTAFVVWAYADDDPYAYVVWAEKHKNMSLARLAEKGLELDAQFKPMKAKVIDCGGLGGTINNHLNQRFGFACVPAEKKKKNEFIETMNDDLCSGLVKVLPRTTGALVKEWLSLETDDEGDEPKRQKDNHCADAALYGWRRCRHFLKIPSGPPAPGEEGYDEWHEEQMWDKQNVRGESVWRKDTEFKDILGADRFSEVMSEDWGDLG